MLTFIRKNPLILICAISFLIFAPSLFVFFTNDDFYFLNIGRFTGVDDFLSSFNLIKNPDGFGMYRPLGAQVFYWTAWGLFNLNPIGQHAISFAVFFAILYFLNKLIIDLTANKPVALITVFIYAVSATHFAHFYYLATFQELLMTLFVLLTVSAYLRKKTLPGLTYFTLALMSKETAVVTPLLLLLIYYQQKYRGFKSEKLSKTLKKLTPFLLVLGTYMFLRINYYGFATGDSYVWNFNYEKLINTLFWYSLWTLNLPETVLDFVGPGLILNPDLLKYFGDKIIPIFIFFVIQTIFLGSLFLNLLLTLRGQAKKELYRIFVFSMAWFVIALLPVAFLPVHKFSFYLTLPMCGGMMMVGWVLNKYFKNTALIFSFLIVWTTTSVLTVNHTVRTNWITISQAVSFRVLNYFNKNPDLLSNEKITFIDTEEDLPLPWSPADVVKTALSDQNFFYVYFPQMAGSVSYGTGEGYVINARQFLGY
jgi:hypothetical protein